MYLCAKLRKSMSNCEQCVMREFNVLNALTKEELFRVSNCKKAIYIKKGDNLFEEGQAARGVFCVKKGVCKITKLGDNGKHYIVRLIGKGSVIGERSLVNDEPHTLTATAIENMEVCFVPKSEMVSFLQKNNNFSLSVLKNFSDKLKETNEDLVNMAQKTVRERLAHTLLYLHEKFGENQDKTLSVQLSREELSGIIGTAVESCIRLLSDFKKEGIIDLIGKKISIIDDIKLRKMD